MCSVPLYFSLLKVLQQSQQIHLAQAQKQPVSRNRCQFHYSRGKKIQLYTPYLLSRRCLLLHSNAERRLVANAIQAKFVCMEGRVLSHSQAT